MTVTKNEFGQQNMWATEPTMYMSKEDLDRYGIETYAEKAEKLWICCSSHLLCHDW
jgi:hypothetical protein